MEWDENLRLLAAWNEGDETARERLVLSNAGLIWSIVHRFQGRGYDREELFQIGNIGLLKAIDKFDFSFDVRFSTYAVPIITGEIRRFLRDDGPIKISRSLKELSWKTRQAEDRLGNRLGREPTLLELAEELGMDAEEVASVLEVSQDVESLNQPVYQSDGKEIPLMDRLEEPENEQEKLLNHMVLDDIFTQLSPEEKHLVSLRYVQGKTQMQVAGELGMSQVQVSRSEKRLLQKIRRIWTMGQ
ncbi:MAG: SigB/SigF/SigG family RNA polymerase sigma factor [Clostridiales bacterium]|nr:SigB/SigF/SigG family RNA polymerase sigma factor [Clostridiales bacterium]